MSDGAAVNRCEIQSMREGKDVAIAVDHVSMVFNMASERIQNLKEYFIKIVKHELMFKEFIAVDDVSFTVECGDVFGLVGSNGSGKSTLLKIIAGVLEPSKGTCDVNGSIAPLIELGAGFDMELSARENIYLNGALLGYSKQFIDEHFESIVDFAEIEDFLEMPMKNYSSGMVARIAFAIATETVPDILIVDEVLSVGDYMFQEKCEKRINALINDHDVTVLIVSHDNALIERLCNKAVWIEKGHLKLSGDAETVCSAYRLLGWDLGSKESEGKLIELLQEERKVSTDVYETISADDPCATSIAVWDENPDNYSAKRVILAPYDFPALCMLANSVSSRMSAPLLLIDPKKMSGAGLALLKRMPLEQVILMGSCDQIGDSVADQLASALEGVEVVRVDGEGMAAISLNALALEAPMGNKVILTYPECTADLLSIMPYAYKHRIPLLFNEPGTALSERTIRACSDASFDEVILFGGQRSFPDQAIEPLMNAGLPITRICGTSATEAKHIILDWISKADPSIFTEVREVFFVSLWNPVSAFSVGKLTYDAKAIVLLQVSKNIDTVLDNIEIINSLPAKPEKVTFFGDDEEFREVDKRIIAKGIAAEK